MKNLWHMTLAAIILAPSLAAAPADNRTYASWRAFFTFVAESLLQESDPDRVFSLATESDVDYLNADLILVRPNLYRWANGTRYNELRGASGNGEYYLLKSAEHGLYLVGTMQGGECKHIGRWVHENANSERFECKWHNSAASYAVKQYESDGQRLKQIATFTVENGKRKP